MLWCSTCVAGPHLPAFAAETAGLFTEAELDVELTPIIAAPDSSLRGLSERARAVADGRTDVAFTSVAYFLAAQSEAGGTLPARFVAVCHQRSQLAALIAADSELERPADLGGRRTSSRTFPWFVREYQSALETLGIKAPTIVDSPAQAKPSEALARGEVDALPTLIDMLPMHAGSGQRQRAIALDLAVYGSGLVAADRLSLELVERLTGALRAGFELQRERPGLGIGAYRRRFPHISDDHIRSSWAIYERYALARGGPGAMDAEAWQATIDYTSAVHGLRAISPECVYRPELLGGAIKPWPQRPSAPRRDLASAASRAASSAPRAAVRK